MTLLPLLLVALLCILVAVSCFRRAIAIGQADGHVLAGAVSAFLAAVFLMVALLRWAHA